MFVPPIPIPKGGAVVNVFAPAAPTSLRQQEWNDRFERDQFGQSEEPRRVRGVCPGCTHRLHQLYACPERPLFTREGRCGCESNYGDVPPKWLP